MVPDADKEKFLAALEIVPTIVGACMRSGVARQNIYRWLDDDPSFKNRFDAARERGRQVRIDVAENGLFQLTEEKNLPAIRYLLRYHDKRYYEPRKAVRTPSRKIQTINLRVIGGNGVEVDVDKERPVKNIEPPKSGGTSHPTDTAK